MMHPQFRFRGQVQPVTGLRASLLQPEPVDGTATLRLYDPIDSWGGEWGVSAKEFVLALDGLPADTDTIDLHVNSPGGEVFEGVTIMNALRQHRARVVATVDGIAASAASFLVASADEVVMAENSQMMIHDAWGLALGNAADMRRTAEVLDGLSDNIASVYAKKAGGSVTDWRAVMIEEAWFSAEEAVERGLADRIAEPVKVENAFDLSVFKHQGREQAPPPPDLAPAARDDEEWLRAAMQRRLDRKRPPEVAA